MNCWIWSYGNGDFGNTQSPTYSYNTPGTYEISLITSNGFCHDTCSQNIEVMYEFFAEVPQVFTPNNDGLNDTFSPSLLNIDMNSYNLLIYDRWGNKIFETYNYEQGWDGKLTDGTMLPPDVYSYKVIYNTNLGVEKKETGKVIMAR